MRYRAVVDVGGMNVGEVRDFTRAARDVVAGQNGFEHWQCFIEADSGQHFTERPDYDATDPFYGSEFALPVAPEVFTGKQSDQNEVLNGNDRQS